LRVSLLLFMRKKFLMRCETWLLDPLSGLLVDTEAPEKVRFSVMLVCVEAEELKSCVIVVTQRRRDLCRRKQLCSIAEISEAAEELAEVLQC
jgi:hypothetical protein